jgi:RNA polymerase sigma factor (sigma-70 family)
MAETLAAKRKGGSGRRQGSAATVDDASVWFVREILPLEPILMRYLRRNWKNASDIADLRQEVYTRTFDAARTRIPDDAGRFLVVTARNLLIDLVRHTQVVPIESIADLETLDVPSDAAGPDRTAAARDELRHLQAALERLPPQEREVVTLTCIEDLRMREIAARMGVNKSTVSRYLASGLRTLADTLYGEPGDRGGKS